MKDLVGNIYNKWTVLSEVERDKHNKRVWLCECTCRSISKITQDNLIRNLSTQCKNCSIINRKKKQDFLREDHRLYSLWKNMKNRINNPNRDNYHRYGGRGIKICDRWYDFLLFLEDMENSFEEGLSLERVDNDGDYCPENCKWATKKEQSNNQEKSLELLFEGVIYTESQLSEKTGVNRTTIQRRRNAGYSVEEMIYGRESVVCRKSKSLEYDGSFYSFKELSDLTGVDKSTIAYRVKKGYNIYEVINGRSK